MKKLTGIQIVVIAYVIIYVVGIMAVAYVETKKSETHLTTPQPCVE